MLRIARLCETHTSLALPVVLCLNFEEFLILPSLGDQFVVSAKLRDPSIFQESNPVAKPRAGKPM
jgi:hypothetical protein